jgi:hypothetical protein
MRTDARQPADPDLSDALASISAALTYLAGEAERAGLPSLGERIRAVAVEAAGIQRPQVRH